MQLFTIIITGRAPPEFLLSSGAVPKGKYKAQVSEESFTKQKIVLGELFN